MFQLLSAKLSQTTVDVKRQSVKLNWKSQMPKSLIHRCLSLNLNLFFILNFPIQEEADTQFIIAGIVFHF